MSKKLARETASFLPAKIVPAVVGALSIPLLTAMLGAAEYGQYALVANGATLIYALAGAWLASSNLRFFNLLKDEGYGRMLLAMLPLVGIASALIYVAVSRIVPTLRTGTIILVAGTLLAASWAVFECLSAVLRAQMNARWFSIALVWRSAGGLSIGAALIYCFNFGAEGAITGLAAATLLALVPMGIASRISLAAGGGVGATLRRITSYGVAAGIVNVATLLQSYAGRYIVDWHRGAVDTGIFAANFDIAEKTIFFLNSMFLISTTVSAFRAYDESGPAALNATLATLLRWYLIVAGFILIGILAFSREINTTVLPAEFFAGWPVISFAAAGAFLLGILHRYSVILSVHGRNDLNVLGAGIGLLVNVIGSLLLIPRLGIVGAALGSLAGYAAFMIATLVFTQRYGAPRFPVRTLATVGGAGALAGTAARAVYGLVDGSPLLALVAGGIVLTIVYTLVTALAGEVDLKKIGRLISWQQGRAGRSEEHDEE